MKRENKPPAVPQTEREREDISLRECTFHPNVPQNSRKSRMSKLLAKSISGQLNARATDSFVQRLKKAQADKDYQNSYFEKYAPLPHLSCA